MRYELFTQAPSINAQDTLINHVAEIIEEHKCDMIHVVSAYATVGGVRNLITALTEYTEEYESKWLIGLDDYITQPGALELCGSLPSSSLRVASYKSQSSRFHPKVIFLSSSQQPQQGVLIVGSSNVTRRGLSKNAEASMILSSESSKDILELKQFWEHFWKLGHQLSEEELQTYKDKYKEAKVKRAKSGLSEPDAGLSEDANVEEILGTDRAEIDPTLATTCWIEVGRNTAMGRELEFKAEQALFFNLSPHGGKPEFKDFIVSNGTTISLRLKYQENSMWRLQMNNNIPEVENGLRPSDSSGRLLRSPYVAVFDKLPDDKYRLRFIDESSPAYVKLRKKSAEAQTLGRTSARSYGWF